MIKQVVLSRKGFDSRNGGKASPIYKKSFYSIPIPEVNSGIMYKDLIFSHSDTYLKLITDLGVTQYTECHLDPDLTKEITQRIDWVHSFGQCDNANDILKTHAVGKNTLFLFYGWFKQVEQKHNHYRFKNAQDVHAIYGYLLVYKVFTAKELIRAYPSYNHPHLRHSRYAQLDYYSKKSNNIYTGNTRSQLFGKKSFGIFTFSHELILTAISSSKRSIWKLPRWFKHIRFHGKYEIISEDNNDMVIQFKGRNQQELIISDDHNLCHWVEHLIRQHGAI